MEKKITLFSALVLLCTFSDFAQTPVKPKMTDKTIFVAVKEYVEIDPVVDNGVIKISNSGVLSYVDLNGKYIFGEDTKLTAGGSSYDKSRGRFSGGTAVVARGSYPNLVQNAILFFDQKYLDLPATYQKVTGFCEGIAMAEKPSGSNKACCYINQSGQEVFPSLSFPYSYFSGNFKVSPLREGLRAFLEPNLGLWGYADESGKIIIKPQFSKALPFSEGLAAVAIKENYSDKWGFIDKTGKIVVPAILKNFPSSFSDGLAVIKTDNGKMAYIDKTGKVVSPEFYQCNVFHNGYAFVNTDYCKTAVIDKKFEIVKTMGDKEQFEIQGDNAENILEMPFYEDMLAVKTCFGSGGLILNPKGDILFKDDDYTTFENFYNCEYAVVKFRLANKYFSGLMDKKGELHIVFVTVGTTLSPPDFPKAYTAQLEEPKAPTAGKGTFAPPSNCDKKGSGGAGSRAAIPVSKECELTLLVSPAEAGTAETATAGKGKYIEGTSILLQSKMTHSNKYKYKFSHWENESKDTVSKSTSFYYTIPANCEKLTAVYAENPKYKLTLKTDCSDWGIVFGEGEYYEKEPVTVSAKVKGGYKFIGWYLEENEKKKQFSKEATFVLPMPKNDVVLFTSFCTIKGDDDCEEKCGGCYMDWEPKNSGEIPEFPCKAECGKSCAYAGEYVFTLSAQSVVGEKNSAAPVRIPAKAYMEIYPCDDMPMLYTGDVLGVIYFDFDPIKIPDDIKKIKRYMDRYEAMGDYLFLYYSPLYIYRITDQYIYAMGAGFMGADKAPNEFWSPGRIYRFEYTKKSEFIELGKYQIYHNRVIRTNGYAQNKYEWINQGLVRGTDLIGGIIDTGKPLLPDNIRQVTGTEDYIYEPEKEDRYRGVKLYPIRNRMNFIPLVKPNMLEILNKSLKHPKAVNIGVDDWCEMMEMIFEDNYEKLYKDLQNYNQPDTVTDKPFPTFDS